MLRPQFGDWGQLASMEQGKAGQALVLDSRRVSSSGPALSSSSEAWEVFSGERHLEDAQPSKLLQK